MKVTVCDVGPRDGLQNDEAVLAPAVRAELCERLAATGLPRVEAASFVHPKLVPQMAGAEEVFAALPRRDGVTWAALVLNRKGLERAIEAQAEEIHVAYPVTETFARRNQNMGVEEAATAAAEIVQQAHAHGLRATVTLAASFGCPFEGRVDPGVVADHARRNAAADELMLADTIGVGVPGQVKRLLERGRRPGRPAPAQHAQHRLRQRLRGAGGGRDAVRRLGRRPRRLPVRARAPPATSPPRTCSTCSRARGSTPASTSTA